MPADTDKMKYQLIDTVSGSPIRHPSTEDANAALNKVKDLIQAGEQECTADPKRQVTIGITITGEKYVDASSANALDQHLYDAGLLAESPPKPLLDPTPAAVSGNCADCGASPYDNHKDDCPCVPTNMDPEFTARMRAVWAATKFKAPVTATEVGMLQMDADRRNGSHSAEPARPELSPNASLTTSTYVPADSLAIDEKTHAAYYKDAPKTGETVLERMHKTAAEMMNPNMPE